MRTPGATPRTDFRFTSMAALAEAHTAVLGPTNTGKTHLAIERLLGHETRRHRPAAQALGARGLCARRGARRRGPGARWSPARRRSFRPSRATGSPPSRPCRARPTRLRRHRRGAARRRPGARPRLHRPDPHLRGSQETLLLGAATMRGIIEQLLPGVHVVTRPRMSVLAYAGQKKLTRLPERSRRRHVLRRRGLCGRGIDPPPARRRAP